MRRFLSGALWLGALHCFAANAPSIPRPAAPFKFHLTDGTPMELATFRGKVCVVEFLFTTCPHCQQTSQVMSKLNAELGPLGFQPLGVAFNDNAIMLVPDFIKRFGVNYPTGVAPREKVLEFLGHSSTTRLMVPQVAIIDRKGMIRFQSSIEGDENLHGEASLREKIRMLLAEGAKPAPARSNAKTKSK